jgi:hypothetical protein
MWDIFQSYNEGLDGAETRKKGINVYFTPNIITVTESESDPAKGTRGTGFLYFSRHMKKLPRDRAI